MNRLLLLSVIVASILLYSCNRENVENIIIPVEKESVSCLTNKNDKTEDTNYKFEPIKKGTVSCSIKINDQTGEMDLAIKNILKKDITFTKPRIIPGLGVNGKLDARTNPIEIEMTWGVREQDFARLGYATYEDMEIKDQVVTLKPNEITHVKFKLENTVVERRCNLVPFNECFSKGKTRMSVVVCLMGQSVGEEDVKIAVSNTNTIHRQYIY